jgi:hypothetical protein
MKCQKNFIVRGFLVKCQRYFQSVDYRESVAAKAGNGNPPRAISAISAIITNRSLSVVDFNQPENNNAQSRPQRHFQDPRS